MGFQAFCLLLFKAIDMFCNIFRVFFFWLNMIGNELFLFGTLDPDFSATRGNQDLGKTSDASPTIFLKKLRG
jgi:hypothetical protein